MMRLERVYLFDKETNSEKINFIYGRMRKCQLGRKRIKKMKIYLWENAKMPVGKKEIKK